MAKVLQAQTFTLAADPVDGFLYTNTKLQTQAPTINVAALGATGLRVSIGVAAAGSIPLLKHEILQSANGTSGWTSLGFILKSAANQYLDKLSGLVGGQKHYFKAVGYNELNEAGLESLVAAGTTIPDVVNSTEMRWPLRGAFLISSTDYPLIPEAELAARARCDIEMLHWQPGKTNGEIQDYIDEQNARRAALGKPPKKFFSYANESELQPTGAAWTSLVNIIKDFRGTGLSQWAVDAAGTFVSIATRAVNQWNRWTKAGWVYAQHYYNYVINSKGLKNIAGLTGLGIDNIRLLGMVHYSGNYNSTLDNRRGVTMRAELQKNNLLKLPFIKAQWPQTETMINGLKSVLLAWLSDGIDDVAGWQKLTNDPSLANYFNVEAPWGRGISEAGLFVKAGGYTNAGGFPTPNWGGYKYFLTGAAVPSTGPTEGSLVRAPFGNWDGPVTLGGGASYLAFCKLLHTWGMSAAHPDRILFNNVVPSMAKILADANLRKYMRMLMGLHFTCCDHRLCLNEAESTYTRLVEMDEMRPDYGLAITGPGCVVGPQSDGTYFRQWENFAWVANPYSNVDVVWTPPVINGGANKLYFFDPSPYAGIPQARTAGQKVTAAFALPKMDGQAFLIGPP